MCASPPDRLSPFLDLPHGRRPGFGGGRRIARARHSRIARGRRFGLSRASGGSTNLPVIMVAERAADFIRKI